MNLAWPPPNRAGLLYAFVERLNARATEPLARLYSSGFYSHAQNTTRCHLFSNPPPMGSLFGVSFFSMSGAATSLSLKCFPPLVSIVSLSPSSAASATHIHLLLSVPNLI